MSNRLVRAASFLGADVAARAVAFAVLLAGARALGSSEFGRFALVVAIVSVCLLVADFGLTPLALRRMSSDEVGRRATVWSASAVNLALSVVAYTGVLLGFWLIAPSYVVLVALYGTVILIQAIATSVDALLFAVDRTPRVGANRLLGNIVLAVAAAIALGIERSAAALAVAFVVAAAAKLALGLLAAHGIARNPTFDRRVARRLLGDAVPFAIAALVSFLYFRIDIVLLGVLANEASVGHYAAAYRVVEGFILIPAAIAYTAFPGWMRDAPARRQTLSMLKIIALFGVAASLLIVILGPYVLDVLLGAEYAPSGRALQILALAMPVLFIDVVAIWVAYSQGLERQVIKIGAVALSLNVSLNLVLIPRYGINGAAAATVVSEVANFLGYAIVFRAAVARRSRQLASTVARLAGAVAVATVVVVVARKGPLPLAVDALSGAVAFSVVVVASGFLTPAERRLLVRRQGI